MAQSKTRLDALAPVDGLQVKLTGGVLSVTLDRPDSLNSLTPEVLAGVADAFEAAAADPRVRVVRLGGNGRGFCSGAGIGKEETGDGHNPMDTLLHGNRAIQAIAQTTQQQQRQADQRFGGSNGRSGGQPETEAQQGDGIGADSRPDEHPRGAHHHRPQ